MHRTRSSLSYDFLVGDLLSANMSSILLSLSYFPPPPPFIPGPPPRRSWKCSTRSMTSSCLAGDDRHLPVIRPYVPIRDSNQSMSSNIPSSNGISPQKIFPSSSLLKSIFKFFQNPSVIILCLILISIIFLLIIILLFILCWQRTRQQQRTRTEQTFSSSSNNHPITHNNSTNNTELNCTKQVAFYHRLIPYRRKHSKRLSKIDEKNSIRLRNHHQQQCDSPVAEVVRLSIVTNPKNDQSESEETL